MKKKLLAVLLALSMIFTLSVTAFAAPPSDFIGEAKAKEIVLKDSGFSEDEVKFFKIKLDYDDGKYEYEIEFRIGSAEEYEYTLDAVSGKITDYDYDYDPPYDERYDDYDDMFERDEVRKEREVKSGNWLEDFIRELVAFIRAYFA